jgi:hypothetical protein
MSVHKATNIQELIEILQSLKADPETEIFNSCSSQPYVKVELETRFDLKTGKQTTKVIFWSI